jgi:hypothetical protein
MESAASFCLVIAVIKGTAIGDNESGFCSSDGAP